MPHLRYSGRTLQVAGDDLALPALCSIAGRIFWLALICIVYGITYHNLSSCYRNGWVFQTFLSLSIALLLTAIVVEMMIIKISAKGSLTAQSEREELTSYISTKITLTIFQVVWSIFGILALSLGSQIPCDESLFRSRVAEAFVALVVISQIIDALFLACCCYFLTHSDKEEPMDESRVLTIWENRCRQVIRVIQYISCGTFGGNNVETGLDQVARVLTTFFHHNGFLDVVASDVIAGIVLVRIEQSIRKNVREITPGEFHTLKQQISKRSISGFEHKQYHYHQAPSRSPIAPDDIEINYNTKQCESVVTIFEIDDWTHAMVFALAIYSHLMALYMHPCTGICRLACHCECCNVTATSTIEQAAREALVEGDNCCGMNRAGLHLLTSFLRRSELLFVSFRNDTTHKPYGVFLDHDKEWLVIAIRGTLSLEDCMTDVACEPEEMHTAGEAWGFDGRGRWAHGGMLRAALHIRQELQRSGMLRRILGPSPSPRETGSGSGSANFSTPLTEVKGGSCSHYRLVVSGHSLGAGTAALLALMLRREYPQVVCYAFGAPGSVVDEDTSGMIAGYVTSIVLGNDFICRLNYHALSRLRNSILDAIVRAKVNKLVIMRAVFHNRQHLSGEELVSMLMYPAGEEPDTPFKASVHKFKDEMSQKKLSPHEEAHSVELTIPGRVVHLMKRSRNSQTATDNPPRNHEADDDNETGDPTRTCYSSKRQYMPKIRPRSEMKEIVISSTMGADHFPDRYYYELKDILQSLMKAGIEV